MRATARAGGVVDGLQPGDGEVARVGVRGWLTAHLIPTQTAPMASVGNSDDVTAER
jgi:hypothetical protein